MKRLALFTSLLAATSLQAQILTSEVKVENTGGTTSIQGNVGIGTSSPNSRLHIAGGDLLLQNQSGAGYPILWLKNVSGLSSLRFDYNSIIGEGDNMYIRSGNAYSLALNDNGGNVGIGTQNPTQKLDVRGGYIKVSDAPDGSNNAFVQGGSSYSFFGSTSATQKIAIGNATRYDFMVLNPASGNIGIGTSDPEAVLHLYNASASPYLFFEKPSSSFETGIRFGTGSNTDFYFYTDDRSTTPLQIQASGLEGENDINPRLSLPKTNKDLYLALSGGKVGIGTSTPGYTLDVNGSIRASGSVTWPDFVFYDNYTLPSISEIEKQIRIEGHLSNIPSAKEVERDGVNLVEMDAKLLLKIEELTLYLIEQDRELKAQRVQNQAQQDLIEQLEKKVSNLERQMKRRRT